MNINRTGISHGRLGAAAVVVSLVAAASAVAGPCARTAHAASVVNVNNIVDLATGGCETTGQAPVCTLREAIYFANHHPGSTINIPDGTFTLTIPGVAENEAVTGDLDILHDTTLIGAGRDSTLITASGSFHDRVLDITANDPSITVSISGVTLFGGEADDGFGGGGMWVGAGANVTLNNARLQNNISKESGGAIAVIGGGTTRPTSLSVVNSIVGANAVVATETSAMTSGGGAIYTFGTSLTIVNSTISSNGVFGSNGVGGGSPQGGGISLGGGIFADAGSQVSIAGSTIRENLAVGGDADVTAASNSQGSFSGFGAGGGVTVTSPGSTLSMTNSTVASNTAQGGRSTSGHNSSDGWGGGMIVNAPTTFVNVTVTHNHATAGSSDLGGTPGSALGGGVFAQFPQVNFANTIVAGNDINPPVPSDGVDVYQHFTSAGHNLVGVREGAQGYVGSDLTGSAAFPLDPELAAALADNGGSTRTFALLPGSPAINAGDNAVCAAPLPPAAGPNGAGGVDQRGVARPQPADGLCDIGAFEYKFAPSTTVLTSSVNPADPGQAVTLTATVTGTGGTPSGTVTIRDGGTSLGGGTLAGGVVTVTTAALARGTHALTATYEGDTFFVASTGALSQVIGEPNLLFYPLPKPVRLLDTRPGHTAFVAPGVPLSANQTLTLPGRFSVDSITIPVEAQALVGNATVDNTAGVPPGFATLWPSGSELPLASNLNFVQGTVRPNAFTVGLGADGKFNLLSNTGGHFIIDITGFYAPPATGGLYFHPLAQPVRLLDTRTGADAIVHPGAPLSAGQTLGINGRFTSNGTTVPASAKALAGNATVDNTINAPPGFATLFPGGTDLPPTSNLNFAAGTIAPNAFTVGLGGDGSFQLFSNTGGNFIIDVTGYYDDVPTGGLLYHPLPQPARELDTRIGQNAAVHPDAPLTPSGTLTLPGAFSFNNIVVPNGATALLGNATVDNTVNAPAGFATLYPAGATLPLASNLNYEPGLVAPNAFIVGIGAGNSYNLFSQSGSNFIIDISGYFAPT